MNLDMGDVPTWGAGIFAAAAAAFAGLTLKSQREQIREQRQFIAEQSANLSLEREALIAAAASRREEQARLLSTEERHGAPLLWNNSSAPVTDLACESGGELSPVGFVADSDAATRHFNMAMQDARARECPVAELAPGQLISFSGLTPGRGFRILFTDDAGHRWSLDQHSVLRSAAE